VNPQLKKYKEATVFEKIRRIKLPSVLWGLIFFLAMQVLLTVPIGGAPIIGSYWRGIIFWGVTIIMVSLGMNLMFGFNGQLNLGIYSFYAIGAYVSADITYRYVHSDTSALVVIFIGSSLALFTMWANNALLQRFYGIETVTVFLSNLLLSVGSFWITIKVILPIAGPIVANLLGSLPNGLADQVVFFLALVCGTIFTGIVSYLISIPLLQLGSDYLAIATMGFSIIVYVLLQNNDTLLGLAEMKGARGMVGIPQWTTWPWVFFSFVVILLIMRNLLRSSTGRAIISIREDARAAALAGINVPATKILAFVIGCSFAGLAGGIRAHDIAFLHPKMFDLIQSFNPFIIVIFGGLGSMTGTIVAGGLWVFLLEGLLRIYMPEGFESWRMVMYPLILLVLILLRPGGLLGTYEIPFLRRPKAPRREKIALAENSKNVPGVEKLQHPNPVEESEVSA
jgi:branched-chain amino acid transport system permease protein